MRAVIAYESMYGHTHQLADAIAGGFDPADEVTVTHVSELDLAAAPTDVLIVGVPTHAHGLPRPSTRRTAIDSAHTKYDDHPVDPSAERTGVREWLQRLPDSLPVRVAAYDTRFRPPAWLVGHPARRITRELRRHGATVLAAPESFFIDKHEQLVAGELERARQWGEHVRREVAVNSS